MSPMAELTTEKKCMQISKKSKDMQHNGQRKRRTCNTTQWPKETKDMQHNTMAKGNEGHATQHNGQRKRRTYNTTQWSKEKNSQQNTTQKTIHQGERRSLKTAKGGLNPGAPKGWNIISPFYLQ